MPLHCTLTLVDGTLARRSASARSASTACFLASSSVPVLLLCCCCCCRPPCQRSGGLLTTKSWRKTTQLCSSYLSDPRCRASSRCRCRVAPHPESASRCTCSICGGSSEATALQRSLLHCRALTGTSRLPGTTLVVSLIGCLALSLVVALSRALIGCLALSLAVSLVVSLSRALIGCLTLSLAVSLAVSLSCPLTGCLTFSRSHWLSHTLGAHRVGPSPAGQYWRAQTALSRNNWIGCFLRRPEHWATAPPNAHVRRA